MKITKKIGIFLILVGICLLVLTQQVKAASYSASAGSTSIEPGKTTTITINGAGLIGKFTVSSSNSNVIGLSESSAWIEDGSKSITVTAKAEGTATITITPVDVSNSSDGVEVTSSLGNKTINITVKTASSGGNNSGGGSNNNNNSNSGSNAGSTTTKSNNANLKYIKVSPKDFTGFSPSKTDYSVTVDNEVTSVKISAATQDSKAKYSVSGTNNLKEGTNLVTILVTAEDGTTKKYTVRVTRLAKEENKTPNIDEGVQPILTSLGLPEGFTVTPEFKSDVYNYQLNLEDNTITELNLHPIANLGDAIIQISGNTRLVTGDNTINIVITTADGTKSINYQITVVKQPASEDEPIPTQDPSIQTSSTPEEDTSDNSRMIGFVLIGLASLGAILGIIFAIIEYRHTLRQQEEEDSIYNGFSYKSDVDEEDEEDNNTKISNQIIHNKEQEEIEKPVTSASYTTQNLQQPILKEEKPNFAVDSYTKNLANLESLKTDSMYQSIFKQEPKQFSEEKYTSFQPVEEKKKEENTKGEYENKFSEKLAKMFDQFEEINEEESRRGRKEKRGKHF